MLLFVIDAVVAVVVVIDVVLGFKIKQRIKTS